MSLKKFLPFLKYLAWVPGYLLYSVVTAWCFGAVWYSNLPWGWLRCILAFVVLILLLAAILVRGKYKFPLRGALGLMGIIIIWYILIPASNDRDWQPSCSRNPYAASSTDGKQLTIHNIRDFAYRTETDFDMRYIDETYNLDDLSSMDYIQVHWGGMQAIAHSMLSFGFSDGRHLVVSVETRLEKNDIQGGLPGMYKQFELLMILGTERDILGLRTNYRHEDVYLYPTRLDRNEIRTVFLDIIRRVNELKDHPRFYNTLSHNCFTSLFPSIKLIRPEMKFDIGMLLNGFTDRKAFEYRVSRGELHGDFTQFRHQHYVNPKVDKLPSPPANYSELIRKD